MKENITVGLIRGRHEMPVSEYIFESEIKDVFDFETIRETICVFLMNRVGIHHSYGVGLNQADGNDVLCYEGNANLVVYVTGLTCVTAELISACKENGISLTLMHFNNTTREYVPQKL